MTQWKRKDGARAHFSGREVARRRKDISTSFLSGSRSAALFHLAIFTSCCLIPHVAAKGISLTEDESDGPELPELAALEETFHKLSLVKPKRKPEILLRREKAKALVNRSASVGRVTGSSGALPEDQHESPSRLNGHQYYPTRRTRTPRTTPGLLPAKITPAQESSEKEKDDEQEAKVLWNQKTSSSAALENKHITLVHPPEPHAVSKPEFSTKLGLILQKILPLPQAAVLFWVCTQTGINSAVLLYFLKQLFQRTIGYNRKKFAFGFLLYEVLAYFNPWKHSGRIRGDPGLRDSYIFKLISAYYPHRNVFTYPLEKANHENFLFAVHPHGVLALSMAPTFAEGTGLETKLLHKKNPNLGKVYCCTVDAAFHLPGAAEWSMLAGLTTAQKEKVVRNLEAKKSVGLYVGGADEALLSGGGKMRIVLKDRMGFVEVALRTGTPLVPVLVFGETALYRQVFNPLLRKFQLLMQKNMQFSLPVFHNFNNTVGSLLFPTIPAKTPLHTVFGAPIEIPVKMVKGETDSEVFRAEVKRLHALYVGRAAQELETPGYGGRSGAGDIDAERSAIPGNAERIAARTEGNGRAEEAGRVWRGKDRVGK
eukprot:GSA120T00018779001.1